MKLKVGVVFGGKSVEHDISIITGLQVMNALDKELYDVIPIYLSKENRWYMNEDFLKLSTFQKDLNLEKKDEIYFYKNSEGYYFNYLNKKFSHERKIDLILPTVHGMGVEDGTIAGFFEILGIPITSASLASSAITQDKVWTKEVLKSNHIATLPYVQIKNDENVEDKFENIEFPSILKPGRLGSSIGIQVAKTKDELKEGMETAFLYDDKIIIEPLLENFREFNCAVLKTNNDYIVSEVEEIKVNNTFYAFSDKYENENVEVSKIGDAKLRTCPANISEELTEEIKKTALKAFMALELKGVSRIDFLYDGEKLKLYVNEVNTIPGSLSFYLFEKKELNFSNMLNHLIKAALIDHKNKLKRITSFESSALNKKSLSLKK